MEETPGVVGSAETESPSLWTHASLREAPTSLLEVPLIYFGEVRKRNIKYSL